MKTLILLALISFTDGEMSTIIKEMVTAFYTGDYPVFMEHNNKFLTPPSKDEDTIKNMMAKRTAPIKMKMELGGHSKMTVTLVKDEIIESYNEIEVIHGGEAKRFNFAMVIKRTLNIENPKKTYTAIQTVYVTFSALSINGKLIGYQFSEAPQQAVLTEDYKI